MASKNWICPHCNRPQTLTPGQSYRQAVPLRLAETKFGQTAVTISVNACANPQCRDIELKAELSSGVLTHAGEYNERYTRQSDIDRYTLRPSSSSKPQPEFIPAALREDYCEACQIRDASPKAAAALARRCLQGMIRDFCGIAKARLIDEIATLKKAVDEGSAPPGVTIESVDAIDHVRQIGNIGAHMEKDVNLIVAVEPGEAQKLIELIEMLFDEWYVARENRRLRLDEIRGIAEKVKTAKQAIPAPPTVEQEQSVVSEESDGIAGKQ